MFPFNARSENEGMGGCRRRLFTKIILNLIFRVFIGPYQMVCLSAEIDFATILEFHANNIVDNEF